MRPMLSGVRVVDLSQMLAGGYGSMLLGDLGAEIIKVEAPGAGDLTRLLGPPFLDGESGYFLSINRNKKSIVIDLKAEEGRQVLYDLVEVSDVVFNNFRPGVMEKLGCGYDTLKAVNPRIIVCSLSGYGATGPSSQQPAFDLAIQAVSGAMSVTGEPGRPPVRMGVSLGDLSGSMFCAYAIASALYAREVTGEGRHIDIGLMDCLVSLLINVGHYYLLDGQVPGPMGSQHVSVVPYQAFRTADIYIVVAVYAEKFWEAFCRVLELEELIDDSRFCDNLSRTKNRDELIPILEERFRSRPGDEWLRLLSEAQVPSGPINTLAQVFADPQTLARNMVVQIDHEKAGKLRYIGNPVKTVGMEEGPFEPAPLVGEHTDEVLRGVLGYANDSIALLRAKGAVG
jgi:crotonobetainyl-CoA:carnitine CoA-transferase CaiB-like acyl-CoA transferase